MVAAWESLGAEILRDPDAFIDERDSRRLQAFTRRVFPTYQPAEHIARLCAALERVSTDPGGRLIVTFPPRHSKSLHVSEHLPAWYLGNHPDERVIAVANTAELAHTFSRRVRNKFVDPAWPFPGVHLATDLASVRMWDIEGRRGGYLAVGVGGTPTGHGANLLVIDDPIRSAADADSETVREALWEWYTGTIRTRLEPDASIVITATRWHEDDLTGRLLAAQETGGEHWDHLHMPAIDEDGAPLWPERWPIEKLLPVRGAVGERAWEAQYQGRPSPAEGGTFKRQWWQRYRELPTLRRVEQFVDSAFKDGVGNDPSVVATWGIDGLGSAYLIDIWRKRVQYPELLQGVHHAHAVHRHRATSVPVVVEDKASGQSAIQTLRRPLPQMHGDPLPALPVIPYPVKAGESKESRAEAISPFVEAGRVFIPESASWLHEWLAEHDGFPHGKHDDQVDTTSMALARLLGSPRTLVFG